MNIDFDRQLSENQYLDEVYGEPRTIVGNIVFWLNVAIVAFLLKKQKERQEEIEQLAYIALNNLYLKIERGDMPMNVRTSNTLRTLVMKAYPESFDIRVDNLRDWWHDEFLKLPGFDQV
jgi:hypothetical protein